MAAGNYSAAQIATNLARIGALTFQDFLASPFQPIPSVPDSSYTLMDFSHTSDEVDVGQKDALAKLYAACHQAFPGAVDVLRFEQRAVDDGFECTLTITKPKGSTRTFKATAKVSAMAAKESVCDLAILHGAESFLQGADAAQDHMSHIQDDESVTVVLPPRLQSHTNNPVKKIENACLRKDLIVSWFLYRASKGLTCGAILRVTTSPLSSIVYSCLPEFEDFDLAKLGCAKMAIERGVLELPKSSQKLFPPATEAVTLQAFYESLTRPFPEQHLEQPLVPVEDASSWLNNLVQGSPGSGVRVTAFPFQDEITRSGCLLRVTINNEEARSYVVDARFLRRADAKSAVILLAMSDGLGLWIRGLSEATLALLTDEMRALSKAIMVALDRGCQILNQRPKFEFQKPDDIALYGATLTVPLSSTDVRTFVAPMVYANKNDAKAAACLLVGKNGDETLNIIERRTGKTVRVPTSLTENGQLIDRGEKRKRGDKDIPSGHLSTGPIGKKQRHAGKKPNAAVSQYKRSAPPPLNPPIHLRPTGFNHPIPSLHLSGSHASSASPASGPSSQARTHYPPGPTPQYPFSEPPPLGSYAASSSYNPMVAYDHGYSPSHRASDSPYGYAALQSYPGIYRRPEPTHPRYYDSHDYPAEPACYPPEVYPARYPPFDPLPPRYPPAEYEYGYSAQFRDAGPSHPRAAAMRDERYSWYGYDRR
ncbi:hypothetical protein CYLTODRAFT_488007 [Cylindrobasidium torrendii FP15055 ss-10]|uniref:Uncharacterized protein n=1 Tax=Cylindrobasidium torrendii FP15055 ss-10 TaxID=1314674 RepID=A0A0D7BJD7_9AGAR|nr:hypothetical protein CYLTODRAFT_488007 [Cylindrobasidium torrendii FP15055 ss-10]